MGRGIVAVLVGSNVCSVGSKPPSLAITGVWETVGTLFRAASDTRILADSHAAGSASLGVETFHAHSTLAALFCCRLVSSFAQTPQCEAPTNGADERASSDRAPLLIEGLRTMQVPSILLGESRTRRAPRHPDWKSYPRLSSTNS